MLKGDKKSYTVYHAEAVMRILRIFACIFFVLCFGIIIIEAGEYYTYKTDIKPILTMNNCSGCHNWMETYGKFISMTRVITKTKDIPIINPAKPDSSVIVWRLEGQFPDGKSLQLMPFGGSKLDNETIQKVRDWIIQGAPEETVGVNSSLEWRDIKLMFK